MEIKIYTDIRKRQFASFYSSKRSVFDLSETKTEITVSLRARAS